MFDLHSNYLKKNVTIETCRLLKKNANIRETFESIEILKMDGLGNINWWGFSPSLDLISVYNQNISAESLPDEVNILLVNAGDQRHILKTLASKKKLTPGRKLTIRFFVYEKMLELYARDFLLTSLALQHPGRMSLQEKVELYLELYANILVRPTTTQWLMKKSTEFIKYITDLDFLSTTKLSLFDLSYLKSAERDYLEGLFKFWRAQVKDSQKLKVTQTPEQEDSNDPLFPAKLCWDVRLRTYFGNRYDTRKNAYDWDYQMKLIERNNCVMINNRVYSKWRDTGIAYEMRDSAYDTPNRTLASGLVFNDPRTWEKKVRQGYFGDIVIGPYLAYGIDSENKDFYKKQNEVYRYTSIDIAKSNVNNILKSILELSDLDLSKYKTDIEEKIGELKLEEIVEEDENQDEVKPEEIEEYFKLNDIEITFLSMSSLPKIVEKSKFQNFFDIVYFGNSGILNMNESMKKVLKPSSLVMFETAKFMIELNWDQIVGVSEKVRQMATELGLSDLNNYEVNHKAPETKSKREHLDHLIFKFHQV